MKSATASLIAVGVMSLPSRECGLKFQVNQVTVPINIMSLPSRECGLKFRLFRTPQTVIFVTPLAGVWIEIGDSEKISQAMQSLPSRECGLKLCGNGHRAGSERSLPSRECGLKFALSMGSICDSTVTPLAGVWIEMSVLCPYYLRWSYVKI